MAREIDTAQRRAAFITGECRCHEGYKCRNLIDPDCVYHHYADDIAEALEQARRDALEEASKVCREFSKGYDMEWWRETPKTEIYKTACLEMIAILDRLREGV